jgi:hypothetical protein
LKTTSDRFYTEGPGGITELDGIKFKGLRHFAIPTRSFIELPLTPQQTKKWLRWTKEDFEVNYIPGVDGTRIIVLNKTLLNQWKDKKTKQKRWRSLSCHFGENAKQEAQEDIRTLNNKGFKAKVSAPLPHHKTTSYIHVLVLCSKGQYDELLDYRWT